jgi:hypothetical protein
MPRITLEFSDSAMRRLTELAKDPTHDSVPKVIMNALRVYDFAYERTSHGAKIFVVSQDSTQELQLPHQEGGKKPQQPDQPRSVWDRIGDEED